MDGKEDAEAAGDGAKDDGDDFTCVASGRAQKGVGGLTPPPNPSPPAGPYLLNTPQALQEKSQGSAPQPGTQPGLQEPFWGAQGGGGGGEFSPLGEDASTRRWLSSCATRKLSTRRRGSGSAAAVA